MPETTPRGLTRLAFGGDYNPEQWPESVWPEDVRLMREAGVTMVSIGIFSWALLEPEQGVYDFGWLDRIIDLLHENGIRVDLGTPTVSPPAWFYRAHPEALPVTADGTRYEFGSRGAICHSNADYRAAAATITTQLAERYGDHPALALWHVFNEYGVPVSACYCDSCAAHFRRWLTKTYESVDGVNEAWGTAFGASATETSTRSTRRDSPRPPSTRPSRWTIRGSPTPRCARTSSPNGTSCTASRPASRSPPTS